MAEPGLVATVERSGADGPVAGRDDRRRVALAVAGWAAVVLVCRVVAEHIMRRDGFAALRLGAAPLVGRQEAEIGLRLLPALLVGGGLVAALPAAARRLPWRRLLIVVVLAAVAWVATVNLTRPGGLTRPLERPGDEYLVDVPLIDDPREFLREYPDRIDDYAVHTRSHPPGFILLLWSMDEVGLGGAGWAAALVVSVGAAGLAAVLIGLREVAGERVARRAAPFVVLAPAALWIGSSADALYAGVGATGVAAVLVASGWRGRRSVLAAGAGGLALGLTLTFSYGLGLLGLVALPTLVARRRLTLLGPVAVAALVPVALLWSAGFDYLEGFAATRVEVAESVQSTRPLWLFLVLNPAVLGIACGPAVVGGLARLHDRSTWLVVGGALLGVLVADVSGLSKGEVERIWLPFTVWLLVAGSAHEPPGRGWLALQVAVAVGIQAVARTGW